MSIISKIFGGGISELVDSIGNVIDKTSTTDREKGELKLAIQAELHGFWDLLLVRLREFEEQITERHRYDMGSDSWLSKNIRPITLAFLTATTVIMAGATIFHLPESKVVLLKPWIELLTVLDVTVFGFYFGSRGIEKAVSMISKAWEARHDNSQ